MPPERTAVRRARLRIALITAAVITLLVTAVGWVCDTVMTRAQNAQVWRELRFGAAVGDLTRPPVCTWLFADGVPQLANAPAGFPLAGDVGQVRRTGRAVERTLHRDGTVYLVRTQPRAGGLVVQAVFDMRYQLADRTHLWSALGAAEVVGLLASVGAGALLGRVSVTPLAEALARQRRFVTDASHELRTPITQAYTRVQVLSRQAAAQKLPDGHREGLDRLTGSLGRLGEVLDDLLLSASLMAGPARQSDHRPLDLAALARSVAAEESETLDGRVTLLVDVPPQPVPVNGVESALRRAVGELLSNAARHTPPGGRIEMTLGRADGTVTLTVCDTGRGFSPAEAERLFERFHRGGDDGRYGLGLALLREVVTRHGGTVTASSRPGHGARFTIRLPACGPPLTPGPPHQATAGRT
ncbi:sensor histidine kinase [Streptomyces sp. NPDC020983]|uniref:sensor histidine kinase n=1 Tax=Streptomyces sp. NPDC020983 TaxID=3365106 RepID=UPI0037B0B860